ncbi:MAG: 50S ribosomal protein L25 [Peptococcaceae bacterium]|jgi:large subunit ribosomal protein L25|nr:50S ribosomal protein L25 [Peptococcaceae bacterium]MDH7526083.1 50S ribosomal protein L25 [Peptococcaceae bacterium]
MEKPSIEVQPRQVNTKHSLKEIRRKGLVPGVIYGKRAGSIPISLPEKELLKIGGANLVSVKLPGGSYPAVVRELQKHPLSGRILHVDFLQVEMDQKIRAEIPVHLSGSAAGLKAGGILQHGERAVEVEALPGELPDAFHVDISPLEIGDKYTVADLQKTTSLTITSDPETVLAVINAPRLAEIEEPAETAKGEEEKKEEPAGEA